MHRRFLELERFQAEKYFNRKINPFEFLQTLTQDKNFAWLRPFSSMLADLDAFIDDTPETDQSLKYITDEISKILSLPQIKERYEHHQLYDADFARLSIEFTKSFLKLKTEKN